MAPRMILWGNRVSQPDGLPYMKPYVQKRASAKLRSSTMMNGNGDFNGSCTREEAMSITPETPYGSCTSYFEDVTDYCCAAVGGVYNATFRAENVTEEQAAALNHPICVTSNYADMFSCYQYVTETHCAGTTPVPYGICIRAGPDTSKSATQSSSASNERQVSRRVQIAVLLYTGVIAAASIYTL